MKKMKKTLNLTMVALLSLFLFACTGNTTNEDEKQDETTTDNNNVDQTTDVLILEEMKNDDVFNGLKVIDFELVEGESFSFGLEGEFVVTGEIMIDEMWGEYAIQIDDNYNPHKDLAISIGDFQKQFISFCYFKNQEAFEAALDSEDLDLLTQGNTITLTVKVKDFSIGGKFDGYGDSSLIFVEVVQE